MSYDGWITFDGIELANLSRTAQLCETLGIDTLWTTPSEVEWIETVLGGVGYDNIANAPWYDAGYPASAEFAGFVPLAIPGFDDSTAEATTVEYITDGGSSTGLRNKTKTMVVSGFLLATTERGVMFGKRWLDRMLRGGVGVGQTFCSGSTMRYFSHRGGADVPEQNHMRDVTLTRGASVTRKSSNYCSVSWGVQFTLTANDPFEYADPIDQIANLGGAVVGAASSGTLAMVEQSCPVYDYSPIFDPLYPALVIPPSAPVMYPAGWDLIDGVAFDRYWARVVPLEPSALNAVPLITLTTTASDARMVRLSIWPSDADVDSTCAPLWSTIITYLPAGLDLVVDAEQQAVYIWDGVSPQVRRADSVAFGEGAKPMRWTAVNDPTGLLYTLDVMDGSSYDGGGTVRATVQMVPKSD